MDKKQTLAANFVVVLVFSNVLIGTLATYNVGDLVKLQEENNEQHIGIIQKLLTDSSGAVTACEIRMTDGSLETVTKNINDPALTSYAPDNP